jgi:ribonuclease E
MLDNEPEGGERTGSQPAGDTADTTIDSGATTAPVTDGPAEAAPVRRTRVSRRRTAVTGTDAGQTGGPVQATAEVPTVSGEAPAGEVLAPVAGDTEAAPKTPRRRRKATTADRPDGPDTTAQAGPEATADAATGPDPSPAPTGEDTPPVKVTRTRRRKAVPPAVVPTADVDAAAQTLAGAQDIAAGPGNPAAAPTGPAGSPAPAAAGPETRPQAAPETRPQAEPQAGPEAEPQAGPDGAAEAAGAGAPAGAARRRRAALSAPTVLFMAPEPEQVATPQRPSVTEAPAAEAVAEEEPAVPEEAGETRRRRRGRRAEEAEPAVEPVVPPAADLEPVESAGDETDEEDDDDDEASGRRRRRRGRRGRGRGRGTAEDTDEEETGEPVEAGAGAESAEAEEDEGAEEDGLTRRRRRRRRKGAGDTEGPVEDGVPTVVRIREPRKGVDEVQGVSGSTRLEAKRQRRRDGREQRRTRPPILSESEFLARREAVDRVMVVRQRGDRTQIAVLEDGVLVEHYVTRNNAGTMAGNVYLGKVQNVLPSMEAAFIDVGRGRNAVLYAGEVNWDSSGLEGRARSIEHALRSGDSVLVQVTKDPIGHKGARLTSHVALSGRHLVYVPHGNASGISRKLPDTERKRLRDVLKKLVPDGAGVIVRTAAEGASEDELARDVKRLQSQWEDIQAKAAAGGAPVLLYEEPDLVIRVVRDLFNEDFRELVVQGDEAYGMVEAYLGHVSPDLVPRLRRHTGTADVFAERRIDEQILKGLDRKVFLPSGGHLVIDRTEAMTVVDVNTGKYTGTGGNLEETVTRNNLEAAEEIVRQLRLRDLGGIVVIDFIDMVLESNRELVLRRLTECLGRDRTKHQVTEITSLGLVQMTRKRIGAGLLEAFSETCECCKGRGLIVHTEPVPDKPRGNGAGDKVKAVASAAPAAPSAPAAVGAGRRGRGRSGTAAASVEVEVEVADADADDTMGYDLSRYEVEQPQEVAATDAAEAESMRLASADDPDAAHDGDDDGPDGATGGRRRSRRGGTRRRTRP